MFVTSSTGSSGRRVGACSTFRLRTVACLLAGLGVGAAYAADGVFELGNVVVQGSSSSVLDGEVVLSADEMARFNLNTVADAVKVLPGATLSRNSRNEEMVYVRGFDPRRVPLFLDGIPLYVPYDGYVDFSRFTTFDLSQVRIAKGTASLLYGPNTLGGAVNLVSRRPTREFEGDIRVGYASGNERKAALNMGTNQGAWYLQAGISWLAADDFPLGRGFKDLKRAHRHREPP